VSSNRRRIRMDNEEIEFVSLEELQEKEEELDEDEDEYKLPIQEEYEELNFNE